MATNGSGKPSKLHISTQSLVRLVKEEKYYHKELEQEGAKVTKLKAEIAETIAKGETPGENDQYMIEQRERAIKETMAVFEPLHKKIETNAGELEDGINAADDTTSAEELEKAKKALEDARAVLGAAAAAATTTAA